MAVKGSQINLNSAQKKVQIMQNQAAQGLYVNQDAGTTQSFYASALIKTVSDNNFKFFNKTINIPTANLDSTFFSNVLEPGKITGAQESLVIQNVTFGITELNATFEVTALGPVESSTLAGFPEAFWAGTWKLTVNNNDITPSLPNRMFKPELNPGSMRGTSTTNVLAMYSNLVIPAQAKAQLEVQLYTGFTGATFATGFNYMLWVNLTGYGTLLSTFKGK